MSGKDPPVGAEALVSPKKSARVKRISARQEDLQAAVQNKAETLERSGDPESAKFKTEVAIMSVEQKETVTGVDKQADVKKTNSKKSKMEVSNIDANTSRKSKRKSKISEENKQSNDNGSGIYQSQNAKETETSEPLDDAINVHGQIKADTSNKRPEDLLNEKIEKGEYLKDNLDNSLNAEHDFKTPKTKRSEKITVTEKINDLAKVSPDRAKVSSDSDKVDDSKKSAVKTNKKTPRRNEAVMQVGDNADKIELENIEEVKKSQTQSDPSSVPKRRGRPPKKLSVDRLNTSLDKSVSESINDKSGSLNDTKNENGTDTIESTPTSARKRKKIDYAALGEIGSEDESDNDDNTPKIKKRKAKKKAVEGEGTEVEEEIRKKTKSKPARSAEFSDDSKTPKVKSANESVAKTPRSSRKRKKIDYAALDEIGTEEEDDTDDDDDNDGAPVIKKRKTKKKFVENSSEDEDTEVEETPKTKKSKTAEVDNESKTPKVKKDRRGRKKAPRKEIQCSRCDQILYTDGDMKRHMAIKHQALWTAENPEGLEDSRSLNQVIKIKKFLICPKCDKQLNFLQYYKQHIQWCGRDNETFTCEICGHHGLLAKWRDMHEKACLRAKAAREEATKRVEALKEQKKEEKEALTGEKRKRRAAKVASNMLHNLSKDKDLNLQDDLDDDQRDEDFKDADEEEEIEEEYEEDEEEEEEEPRSGSDSELEFDVSEEYVYPVQRDIFGHFVSGRRKVGPDKSNHVPVYNKYHLTYEMMNDIQKKHMSKDLYLDLLPKTEEWTALNKSDSQPYLPAVCQSINFTFSKNDGDMQSLQSYESVMVQGFPLCFTGLSIWKMAWCPTPGSKNDKQYLAIVGKPNHETLFRVHERVAAPGIIQIWNMGVTSNSLKAESLPKLAFNIAHDYGMVTDLKWCPSGCWQEDKLDGNTQRFLPRLGLLACSFTDSTVRIFSIPHVPDSAVGSVPTYKPLPVVTLVPHRTWKSCYITCSCVDWQSLHGHTKVVVGYSDGSVRIFHLLTKSSLQILESSPHKILLPCHSFQGHLGLVRSCSWMHQYEDWVFTVGEDSSTYFWDLKNTSKPMNMENTAFMPLRVTSSLMYICAITSSDDNYSLNCNKTRCLEPATLLALASRRVYYTASQSACVWDVSYSNWLTYIIACDSRGLVQGIPCLDLAYNEADTKTYSQRLIMVETEVKWKDLEESQDTNTSKCSCESTEASNGNKCETHSETSCDSQSEHLLQREADVSHSEKLLETDTSDSQSKDLVQETLEDRIDSDSLKQSISDKCEKVTVGSEQRDKSGRKIYPHKTYLQIKSKRPVEENQRKEPKTYSEIIEKKYLKFSEHLSEKNKKRAPSVDENFDTYDRVPISSLHAVVFNPNKNTCCWVAFGGESGLLRLVNIFPLMPDKFKTFYNVKHRK